MDDLLSKTRTLLLLASLFTAFQIEAGTPKNYIVKFKQRLPEIQTQSTFGRYQLRLRGKQNKLKMFALASSDDKQLKKFVKDNAAQIEYIEEDYLLYAFDEPNDPLFSDQDGIKRLQAPLAWETSHGAQEVVVAVSDTGVSLNHEDLKSQVWTNDGEVAGNGVDDDNNGYVDDVHGWNFNANNNNPDDQQSHGSHVSGIIGAKGDNGLGVAGVNWNVTIMPVQFLGADGSGTTSAAINTIIYAADNGAKILNASWGGGDNSSALKDAIEYAFNKGMLVLAAAGNDSSNNDSTPSYPASYETTGLVAVASSAANGSLSSFSNYGATSVHLAAPGSNVLSSVPGNQYKKYSGTSMATPMVAGVAALLLSVAPQLSALQLKNALLNAVDTRTEYQGKLATAGDLNAAKALAQLQNGFQLWPSQVAVATGKSFVFSPFAAHGAVTYQLSDADLGSVDSSGVFKANAKEGAAELTATDGAGNTAKAQVTVRIKSQGGGGSGGCVPSANAGTGDNSPYSGPWTVLFYVLIYVGVRFGLKKYYRNHSKSS